MGKRDMHPRFDFEPTLQPVPQPEASAEKLPFNEQEKPSTLPEKTKSSDGWCGECDMPLGTGNCVRCIRIRRQRGEDYPPVMKVEKRKVVKGRFQIKYRPDVEQVKDAAKAAVEAARREPPTVSNKADKLWQKMNAQEKAAFVKLSPAERDEWIEKHSL